jgi:hypothetical protein
MVLKGVLMGGKLVVWLYLLRSEEGGGRLFGLGPRADDHVPVLENIGYDAETKVLMYL